MWSRDIRIVPVESRRTDAPSTARHGAATAILLIFFKLQYNPKPSNNIIVINKETNKIKTTQ